MRDTSQSLPASRLVLSRVLAALILCVSGADLVAQDSEAASVVQYQHVETFGSKLGIQPPKLLNRRFAKLAVGESEIRYGIAAPMGVIVDTRNRVWIADAGAASIHIFDPAKNGYQQIHRAGDVQLERPAGIDIDRQGRIYVTDSIAGNLLAFDKNGDYTRNLTHRKSERVLRAPTAIALSENARTIYVLDPPQHAVVAFNQEGETIATFGNPGELIEPANIAVVGDDVWVLDTGLHRVQVFTASGRLRRSLAIDGVAYPSGLAYDALRHHYFVGNPSLGTIQAFDEQGRNVGVFGGLGDAVDQVRKIDALYVDANGRVFVVDFRDGKVTVFGELPGSDTRHYALSNSSPSDDSSTYLQRTR